MLYKRKRQIVKAILIPSITKDVVTLRRKRNVLAPLYFRFQVNHPDEVVGIIAMAPASTTTVEASVKHPGEKIR